MLAAGASLAVGRLGGAVLDGVADPVDAVGRQVIDRAPGRLRETAIGTLGTADKPLLTAGTVLVVLAVGGAVGLLSRSHRGWAAAAIGGLWAVGATAVAAVPGTTVPAAVLLAAGAALVGFLALDLLAPPGRPAGARRLPGPAGPEPAVPTRRLFLTRAVGVVTLAGAAVAAGNVLGARALSRVRGVLPVAGRRAVRPPASTPVPGRTALVTTNAALYRIDTALGTPAVDPDSWQLTLSGLVDRPLTFNYADLLRMPQVEAWITLGCVGNDVGGDLVGTVLWQGVLLADLLRLAGVQPPATQLVGRSVDGYTGAFPVALALDGRDALVALGMNGRVLPPDHGFPARLVVPGLYGYESAVKWLGEIQLVDDSYRPYWVRRGYAPYAEFRTQSRIDVPRTGAAVAAGPVRVAGMAWAPHRGVRTAELQVDGDAWTAATLDPDVLGPDAWRSWSVELNLPPGQHTIAVRATDGRGQVQPAELRAVLPDGATGHHTVRVSAA